MKKALIILIAAVMLAACGTNVEVAGEKQKEIYPKFRISVYKDTTLKQWAFVAAKGEKLTLMESTAGDSGKELVKVVRADGTSSGYAEAKYFAEGICVVTEDNTPLFAQPTKTSEIEIRLPRGTVLFITGEKEG